MCNRKSSPCNFLGLIFFQKLKIVVFFFINGNPQKSFDVFWYKIQDFVSSDTNTNENSKLTKKEKLMKIKDL